jgi:hypothetical protein
MATILLTDAEYDHIKGMKQDLLTKAQAASPRAATHYQTLAKIVGDFIAKEDGKRATSKEKVTTRTDIQKLKDARRNGSYKAPAPPSTQAPTTTRSKTS